MAKACGALCRLRNVLPSKIRLLLHNTIFISHANYCNLVLGTTSQKNIQTLFLLQKKALRHVECVPYDSHTSTLFSQFNVLPFDYHNEFNLAMKYRESVKRGHTGFIHLCNLSKPHHLKYSIQERETWAVPFSRTSHGKDRLPCRISVLLNNLEGEHINLHIVSRRMLKQYFLSRATICE